MYDVQAGLVQGGSDGVELLRPRVQRQQPPRPVGLHEPQLRCDHSVHLHLSRARLGRRPRPRPLFRSLKEPIPIHVLTSAPLFCPSATAPTPACASTQTSTGTAAVVDTVGTTGGSTAASTIRTVTNMNSIATASGTATVDSVAIVASAVNTTTTPLLKGTSTTVVDDSIPITSVISASITSVMNITSVMRARMAAAVGVRGSADF